MIDLNITMMGGSQGTRTANETLFDSVGTERSFQYAEEAVDSSVGTYTNIVLTKPIEQRFPSVPQFQGINPFGNLRRF